MTEPIAEIRELFAKRPESTVFLDIYGLLQSYESAEAREVALDYVHAHIASWPTCARALGSLAPFQEGQEDLWPLVHSLRLEVEDLSDEDWKKLSKMTWLKRLILGHQGYLEGTGYRTDEPWEYPELSDMIASLTELEHLEIRMCHSLNSTEALAGMTQLKYLELSHCHITSLGGLEHCGALTYLSLRGTRIRSVVPLGRCSAIEELDLSGSYTLNTLEGLSALKQLRKLDLTLSNGLEDLSGLSECSLLEELKVSRSSQLSSLRGLEGCKALEELEAQNCSALTDVNALIACEVLCYLNLSGCRRLGFESYRDGQFFSRESVEKFQWELVRVLREASGQGMLEIEERQELLEKLLVEKPTRIVWYEIVNLFRHWPEGNHREEALEKTERVMMNWDDSLRSFDTLEEEHPAWTLGRCLFLDYGLKGLDASQLEAIGRAMHLTHFGMSNCFSLRSAAFLSGLTKLRYLDLNQCNRMPSLEGLEGLVELEELRLLGCSGLKDIQGLKGLVKLRRLDIGGCRLLEDFWPLSELTELRWMNMSGCGLIENLDPLSKMTQLEELLCMFGYKLRDISGLSNLRNLRRLKLYECTVLESIGAILELEKLEVLELGVCRSLKRPKGGGSWSTHEDVQALFARLRS